MKNQLIKVLEFYRAFKQPFENSPKMLTVERSGLRHSIYNKIQIGS